MRITNMNFITDQSNFELNTTITCCIINQQKLLTINKPKIEKNKLKKKKCMCINFQKKIKK